MNDTVPALRDDEQGTACPACRGAGILPGPIRCRSCGGSGYGPDPVTMRCLERLAAWASRNLREDENETF